MAIDARLQPRHVQRRWPTADGARSRSSAARRRAPMRRASRSRPRSTPLAGVGRRSRRRRAGADQRLTDPARARAFVERTGIDALAVNVGQMHLHGRQMVRLDLDRLRGSARLCRCRSSCTAPRPSIRTISARRSGSASRKINVGSRLKQSYFAALRGGRRRAGDTGQSLRGHRLRARQRRARRGPARDAARGRAPDGAVRQAPERRER